MTHISTHDIYDTCMVHEYNMLCGYHIVGIMMSYSLKYIMNSKLGFKNPNPLLAIVRVLRFVLLARLFVTSILGMNV